jgi:pimeloyl-ACP methyl ester carboxylesterase
MGGSVSVLRSRAIDVGTIVVLLVAAASCGRANPSAPPAPPPGSSTTSASSPATAATSAPPGHGDFAETVDIGNGRGLYLECHGSGSPTVVLVSGFGNAGDIWFLTANRPPAVANAVAGFTRVCSYDRPGSYVSSEVVGDEAVPLEPPNELAPARGTAVAMPKSTAAAAVADLDSVLSAGRVPEPYVLVGHSLGGLFASLYARTHPDKVAGLVFVDSTTPQLKDLISPKLYGPLLEDQLEQSPSQLPGYVNETYDLTKSLDEISAAPRGRTVPAVVLVAGQVQPIPTPPPGVTRAELNQLPRIQLQAMKSFAATIEAKVVVVPDSSHYIQAFRPDVVIKSVHEVIDQASPSPR